MGAALSPALASQSELATPLWPRVALGCVNTLAFAAAALGISAPLGVLLGVFASERGCRVLPLPARLRASLYGGTRVGVALLRSVHEVLWAVAPQAWDPLA